MFLALLYSLIIHQTVTFANPYHKYPYAFLLDIGNEELQTTSKQFRVSVPGGSLALRYPAIGDGDSIAHVRVTGIDFDNDLKANIVDGGPGSKYVVIVFMGNPDKEYDAVITVSTLDDDDINAGDAALAGTDEVKSYKVAEDNEDSNDSAEIDQQSSNGNHEQLPSASNFYDSAENANVNGKEDESDLEIEGNSDGDVKEETEVINNNDADDGHGFIETDDKKESNNYDDPAPKSEKYRVHEDYDEDSQPIRENNQASRELNTNSYDKYNAVRPHLYNYAQVAQEASNQNEDYNEDYKDDNEVYAPEDPVELDQTFNDEEVHNDRERYNNYGEANSAIAY